MNKLLSIRIDFKGQKNCQKVSVRKNILVDESIYSAV